jgi:cobyrinic acid a,c-diamide synthase
MDMKSVPAILIGGTKSGSGKTIITLGIMKAFMMRGLVVQPYKCGPDFIDPSLHGWITGRTSYNLDIIMMGRPACRDLIARTSYDVDIIVVEGVMGLFDGGEASGAELAKELGLSVVLIVDGGAKAQSAAAELLGFEAFDQEIDIAGVIFNKVSSAGHRALIETAVTTHCTSPILGFFAKDDRFTIESRHLGLRMGHERPLTEENLTVLAERIEESFKLDALISLSQRIDTDSPRPSAIHKRTVRLGLALDEAFCFYYRQNLELLQAAGIELVYFSPLHDTRLPPNLNGIYCGGGYPEIYAVQLAENGTMRSDIRSFHRRGGWLYAECGGFMYLCAYLLDATGTSHEMCNIFPFTTAMRPRLQALGYRRITLMDDCLLGKKATTCAGHEFHYSELLKLDQKPADGALDDIYQTENRGGGYRIDGALASYIHVHFCSHPAIAETMAIKLAETSTTKKANT